MRLEADGAHVYAVLFVGMAECLQAATAGPQTRYVGGVNDDHSLIFLFCLVQRNLAHPSDLIVCQFVGFFFFLSSFCY